MTQNRKSLAYILIGAAAAGVYLEVRRHERLDAAAAASASASADNPHSAPSAAPNSGAPGAAPRPPTSAVALTLAQVEQAEAVLTQGVKAGASDVHSAWALAHGLIAFGRDFRLPGGQTAVSAIGRLLVASGSPKRWAFPPGSAVAPSEPHPFLVLDVLLQVGVPLTERLTTQDGTQVSVRDLVSQALSEARVPADHGAWVDAPWLMDLTTRVGDLGAAATLRQGLASGALSQLAQDTQLIADYRGSDAAAFAPSSPLFAAKREKLGIYGHHCGGLHFMQGALQLAASARAPGAAGTPEGATPAGETLGKLRPQLELLVRRSQLEGAAYAELERATAANPDARRLILVQQLKFFGHTAETLGLARELKLYDPEQAAGKDLDNGLLTAAAHVVRVTAALTQSGAYANLEAIKRERAQTYLDLIGDGCHALRGLRRALPAL